MDEIDRLLARVKRKANGWMAVPVYRRLYETAASRGGGNFVEIGTAQGAATIALALGAKSAGRPFRIYTVDQFVRGFYPKAASVEAKHAIARRTFEAFGVADSIHSIAGTTADLLDAPGLSQIDLLLIDADGRIDRDLALLHPRLAPDCPIIVDDVDDAIYAYRRRRTLVIDQKHRLTHELLRRFVEAGLLEPVASVGLTGWYRPGPEPFSAAAIESLALPAYRELVFAELGAREFAKRALYRIAAFGAPWLIRARHRRRAANAGGEVSKSPRQA